MPVLSPGDRCSRRRESREETSIASISDVFLAGAFRAVHVDTWSHSMHAQAAGKRDPGSDSPARDATSSATTAASFLPQMSIQHSPSIQRRPVPASSPSFSAGVSLCALHVMPVCWEHETKQAVSQERKSGQG